MNIEDIKSAIKSYKVISPKEFEYMIENNEIDFLNKNWENYFNWYVNCYGGKKKIEFVKAVKIKYSDEN